MFYPAARVLASTGVTPNLLTKLGLVASIGVGIALALGRLWLAFFLLLLTSFLDAMDGAVARYTRSVTRFGGFLDAVCDRYADAAILIGIALYLQDHYILIFIVILGSLMVSYSRSKAENYIQRCDVGIAERAERLIILILATLGEALRIAEPGRVFYISLVILALLTHFTVFQRVVYTRRKLWL